MHGQTNIKYSAFLCTLCVTTQTKIWSSFSLYRYGFRPRLFISLNRLQE